jgi:hypothetical protein
MCCKHGTDKDQIYVCCAERIVKQIFTFLSIAHTLKLWKEVKNFTGVDNIWNGNTIEEHLRA